MYKYIVATAFALLLIYSLVTKYISYTRAKKASKITSSKKTVYSVYGMTCKNCSSHVQSLLLANRNVDNAVVDHETNTVIVYGTLSERAFARIIASTKYTMTE